MLARGGRAEFIVGLDFNLTEGAALQELACLAHETRRVRLLCFSEAALGSEGTFHPKLYLVANERARWTVVLGSSNLTAGGLRQNVEINVLLSGRQDEQPVAAALGFYSALRLNERIFAPDQAYLVRYESLRRIVSRAQPSQRAQQAIRELQNIEELLPGTVPTQKGLVVEAIRALRTSQQDWVHWKEITAWVEKTARQRGVEYDWHTLPNSVRGRLNEHTVGKQGDDLFERRGGLTGRFGDYKLSATGEAFPSRLLVPRQGERSRNVQSHV
jgi:phosphatidylserine/phosphatidylglycerophosphate/cardiolipin synthase-like enzyme